MQKLEINYGKPVFTEVEITPEFIQHREEEIKAYEEEQERINYWRRVIASGAPLDRLKEAGFKNWKSVYPMQRNFASACMSYLDKITGKGGNAQINEAGNFVVSGESGRGKTFAALCLIRNLCATRKKNIVISHFNSETKQYENMELPDPVYFSTYYVKSSGIVRAMLDRNAVARHDMKVSCEKADFLVIDEVGRCLQPKAERECLFDILDTRIDGYKPTMIITNMNENEMKDYLGTAVISRLLHNSIFFNTAGIEDLRINEYLHER